MSERELERGKPAGRRSALRAFVALSVFVVVLAAIYVTRPDDFILYIKAFHVVAVMSWMAGLLYMPRLFIYHSDAVPGSAQSETFKMMEHRLLKIIMNPAMMITWVLGLYLAWDLFGFQGGWLHAKIALVVILVVVLAGSIVAFVSSQHAGGGATTTSWSCRRARATPPA